jgi:hypothetical protein
MHHTSPAGAGWALGYAPGGTTVSGSPLWTWQGVNCHPADPTIPSWHRTARRSLPSTTAGQLRPSSRGGRR